MNATAILEDLERRGIKVEVRGDKLRLTPGEAVDSDVVALVREHKPEIMAMMQARPVAPTPDVSTGQHRTPPSPVKGPS